MGSLRQKMHSRMIFSLHGNTALSAAACAAPHVLRSGRGFEGKQTQEDKIASGTEAPAWFGRGVTTHTPLTRAHAGLARATLSLSLSTSGGHEASTSACCDLAAPYLLELLADVAHVRGELVKQMIDDIRRENLHPHFVRHACRFVRHLRTERRA